MKEVEFFKKRELQKFYVTLTVVDVPSYILKGGVKSKETLYVFIGLDLYGRRELVFITYEKERDTRFWYDKFESLKERGLNGVLFACMPNNAPLKRALKASFEGIKCYKNIEENLSKVRPFYSERRSKMDIYESYKNLYFKETKEDYIFELDMFKETFTKDKVFMEDILSDSYKEIEKYYEIDYEIRKMIFAYYYQRDLRSYCKMQIKKAPEILSLDELYAIIITKFINTENRKYCPIKKWEDILNKIYNKNREKIVRYL